MPALASHRKPRTRTGTPIAGLRTRRRAHDGRPRLRHPAVQQSANAAPAEPKPTSKRSQKKVDDLYRQAGTATEKYNEAKETTDEQRERVDTLLDDVAKRTEKLNEARADARHLRRRAVPHGRASPRPPHLLLADNPQDYFDQTQLMDRMTDRQQQARRRLRDRSRPRPPKQRAEATKSLETLTDVAERRCRHQQAGRPDEARRGARRCCRS